MAVGLVPCHLAMVSVVGFLYGIFFVLFCASVYLLIQRQQRLNAGSAPGKPVYLTMPFIGGMLLFMSVTPHWIVVVYRSFEAFIYYKAGSDPYDFYANQMNASYMAETAFSIIVPLLADAMLIWRLWLIWDHNRVVIIAPIVVLVGAIAAGIGALAIESMRQQPQVSNWMTSCYAASVAINVYCCALISRRLIAVVSKSHSVSGAIMSRVLAIFIESASLYVSWMIISFALYETQNGVREALVPMAGIAFMLINVRVGMGYTNQEHSTSHALSDLSASSSSRTHNQSQAAAPIAVHMTHSVSGDMDAQSHISEEKVGEVLPPQRVDVSAV